MNIEKVTGTFERWVSYFMIFFAMVIVVIQVAMLGWNAVDSFTRRFKEVGLHYAPQYARELAVMFFNILLMLEIIQTIKVFAEKQTIKLRIILIVCMIAVSRKILELGEEHVDPEAEFAIAALVIALAVSYFLVSLKISGKRVKSFDEEKEKDE
ncbi:phosphate-starvation-inducible PsiE family protein [Pollutibacter soli]|uniref:phosphate-starvation-inducible PsiE family protein n=1 Tax=Pollutibacter soli TaxID=3034157 RepID=UPI003013B7E6